MGAIRRSGPYLLVSLPLLAPCFWQKRIQAGDLSSHVYNAWLADLISQGKARGLALVPQAHNVLFDLLLSALWRTVGSAPAQRIAVGCAVLVFFWGAFAFIQSGNRVPPWHWTPCLAMLAYGWVFHMGLFNFYISLGISFLALAVLTRGKRAALLAFCLLLALAAVAHVLPAIWAAAVAAYRRAAAPLSPANRLSLAAIALALLAPLALAAKLLLHAQWAAGPNLAFTGADQFWVFGDRYLIIALVMLAVWTYALLRVPGLLRDIRFHILLLNAAGILLLPGIVILPRSGQAENLMLGRMSLAVAVLCCACLPAPSRRRWIVTATSLCAAVFFAFIYQDTAALNRVEDRMEQAIAPLPAGQRVVSALMDTNLRELALLHIVDRVCVGRCFSYANYEPSVGQFRVRALGPNPIVTADFRDSWAMQVGGYVVRSSDLPLYRIDLCGVRGRELCASPLAAGVTLQRRWLHVTPDLWR